METLVISKVCVSRSLLFRKEYISSIGKTGKTRGRERRKKLKKKCERKYDRGKLCLLHMKMKKKRENDEARTLFIFFFSHFFKYYLRFIS